MSKRIMSVLIAVSIIIINASMLISCGDNKEKYKVYYTNTSGDKLIEKSFKADKGLSAKETIEYLLDKMNEKTKSSSVKVIKPESVTVPKVSVSGKTAQFYFKTDYYDMDMATELLYRAAIVKMATQLSDIQYVHFYVDGAEASYQDGSVIGIMSKDSFTDDSNDKISGLEWKEVNIYYANKLGDKLVKSSETLAYSKNISLEKIVIEKLIGNDTSGNSYSTLPTGVKLLSISVSDGICYVNFSEEFATGLANVTGEVQIYSVVNSLCSIGQIDSVKIMVNGDSSRMLRDNINLDTTFKFNKDLVQ